MHRQPKEKQQLIARLKKSQSKRPLMKFICWSSKKTYSVELLRIKKVEASISDGL